MPHLSEDQRRDDEVELVVGIGQGDERAGVDDDHSPKWDSARSSSAPRCLVVAGKHIVVPKVPVHRFTQQGGVTLPR